MRVFLACVCGLALFCSSDGLVWAQTSPASGKADSAQHAAPVAPSLSRFSSSTAEDLGSSRQSTNRSTAIPSGARDGMQPSAGAQGGGARQDWTTLMMLISQTVDPDEWRDFGGTGSSTMLPFPNGIWLDAKGHLKRTQRQTISSFGGKDAAAHQQWLQTSGLRTVSLKRLSQAISENRALGFEPTAQLSHLAGITHIEFVAIDREQHDVLVAGPAGTGDQQWNTFFLEDLCTLADLISDKTAPLGCSLDPTGQGLQAAQQLLNQPTALARLSRSPKAFAEQLKSNLGPHEVKIFGIDAHSSTALALVDADEFMKRVGLGLEHTQPAIKSYFERLDQHAAMKPQSLIRWWFSFHDEPITANLAGDLYQMPRQAVATLSEQQFIAASGQRQATGGVDAAADAFAKELTEKFTDLEAHEPAFARLEGIFELGLALQVAVEASGQHDLHAWFPGLCHEAANISGHEQAPQTVEGVSACGRLRNGTVVAVVSGGVTLDVTQRLSKNHAVQRAYLSRPTKLNATLAASNWWWD